MDNTIKLQNLGYYLRKGWPIFPCHWADNGKCSCNSENCKPGKHPITAHGFYDATTDPVIVKGWHERYPLANWAVRTGDTQEGGCGLVVVDIDTHDPAKNGVATWDLLREEHSEPIETVKVRTGSGGIHLYFRYPDGFAIKSKQDALGSGVDVKANGGYVIIPPSSTHQRYTFEFSPADTEIQELPDWILAKLIGETNQKTKMYTEPKSETSHDETEGDLKLAMSAISALKKERADNYEEWLEVGMSLFSIGQEGLVLWDQWSRQSDKYEPGVCAQKWATFNSKLQAANNITLGSLIHWAEEDGCAPFIRMAPKKTKPSHYVKALEAFGYKFTVNEMNDMIYLNGNRMSDLLMSKIMTDLREYEYKSKDVAEDAIATMAIEHKFHPIKDYLNGLVWEGWYQKNGSWTGIDQIKNLCEYFQDKDGVFPQILRKWLIGAVGRVLGDRPGQQHPMLVLDGPQGIGKSRFAWWLGSPLPAFYIQNSINCQDKDFLILLCSKWIWEVEELGATLRKSDIESLKAFLSKEIINVRKPYGHDEIVKPATASFIGTINSAGGFLADPTGSRRFRVCTLTSVNWNYEKNIDINQVWAQAVALYKEGETHEMDQDMQSKMAEINSSYEVDDPIQYDIYDTFNVEPSKPDKLLATAQIIHRLRTDGKVIGGSDQQVAQRIANVLTRLGCQKDSVRLNGQVTRVWRGVSFRV